MCLKHVAPGDPAMATQDNNSRQIQTAATTHMESNQLQPSGFVRQNILLIRKSDLETTANQRPTGGPSAPMSRRWAAAQK